MARVASTDARLAALRLLAKQPPSPEVTAELLRALRDRSNLVAAAAAEIVGEQQLTDLAPALEEAFRRFLDNPVKSDSQCWAKLALVEALDKMEHPHADIFLLAARHVQQEPVWGSQVDTAANLRAASIIALVRMGQPGLLPLLVDLLTDAEKAVRVAAARGLGHHGTEAAELLLRLKASLGDEDLEVVAECLTGLLRCSAEEHLTFVSRFVYSPSVPIAEGAILALGESRRAEAVEVLTAFWRQLTRPPLREVTLLALAMLHRPAATAFLLDLVATGSKESASLALAALKIQRHDPAVRQQLAAVVRQNGSRALAAQFEKEFPPDEESDAR
jgi:HEAT repeat protein